jgi:hypothetical protein
MSDASDDASEVSNVAASLIFVCGPDDIGTLSITVPEEDREEIRDVLQRFFAEVRMLNEKSIAIDEEDSDEFADICNKYAVEIIAKINYVPFVKRARDSSDDEPRPKKARA